MLAGSLVCLAGALALSVLAPRYGIPDRISFTVSSGYVILMLAFLLSSRPRDPAGG